MKSMKKRDDTPPNTKLFYVQEFMFCDGIKDVYMSKH